MNSILEKRRKKSKKVLTALFKIKFLFPSNPSTLFAAQLPQAIITTPPLPFPLPSPNSLGYWSTKLTNLSVNSSQPFFECDPALWAATVNEVLSKRTEDLAQGVKSLMIGGDRDGSQ